MAWLIGQMISMQRLLNASKSEVNELTLHLHLARQQEATLKAEIRRLERNDVRETVNMEYLKNIVVRSHDVFLQLFFSTV